MQKLDFTKKIIKIVEELHSDEITELFSESLNKKYVHGSNVIYDFSKITPLLFASKSNYDRIKLDKTIKNILDKTNIEEVYSIENLSVLSTLLKNNTPFNVFLYENVRAFYEIHSSLFSLSKLSNSLFFDKSILQTNETQLSKGIVVFQIIIEGDSIDAKTYSDIFLTLNDLVAVVQKINGFDSEDVEIILLDSGSDTNTAIQTTAESAKSIFLIFKEMWDFFTNHKYYKQKQNNQALLDNLSILAEIKAKKDSGVITDEEARTYQHHVKSKTDKLIGLNVIPKQLISENINIDNVQLLNGMKEAKLLKAEN